MAASAARPRTLPGALSGHGHPLSPRECPRRALSPARHLLPVIRGPLPPWSLELWGRAAGPWAKWLEARRPLRPDRPTAKEEGGGPQEMALFRAAAGRFRAETRDPAGSGQAAPAQASLGATGPTLDISGLLHRVPGVVSVELEALPATQRSVPFPVDHTCQPVSHPARGRVPGKS